MTNHDKPKLLRRADVAHYMKDEHGLDFSPQTYAKWAVTGGGPPFRKSGRWPLYDPVDLDEWARSRLSRKVRSTSELPLSRRRTELQPEAA